MSILQLAVTITPMSDPIINKMESNLANIKSEVVRQATKNYVEYIQKQHDEQNEKRVVKIKAELLKHIRSYLMGYDIPHVGAGQKSHLEHPSNEMINTILDSGITKTAKSYYFTVTINSEFASYVEFGTGMHTEIGAKHFITPIQFKYMHWSNKYGNWYAKRTAGQYPKPFLRGAVMQLEADVGLVEGFSIQAEIVFPVTRIFNVTIEVPEVHRDEMWKYEHGKLGKKYKEEKESVEGSE